MDRGKFLYFKKRIQDDDNLNDIVMEMDKNWDEINSNLLDCISERLRKSDTPHVANIAATKLIIGSKSGRIFNLLNERGELPVDNKWLLLEILDSGLNASVLQSALCEHLDKEFPSNATESAFPLMILDAIIKYGYSECLDTLYRLQFQSREIKDKYADAFRSWESMSEEELHKLIMGRLKRGDKDGAYPMLLRQKLVKLDKAINAIEERETPLDEDWLIDFNDPDKTIEFSSHVDTEIDRVSSILSLEESQTFEYKASLQTPYPPLERIEKDGKEVFKDEQGREFKSEKEVKNSLILKIKQTVAAFLNSDGGVLIIGVHEKDNEKELIGIERELGKERGKPKSHDAYERKLNELLQTGLSKNIVSTNVRIEIKEENEIAYCEVRCKKLGREVVYCDEEVFVRSGSSTVSLEGSDLVNWVQRRENNSDSV